MWRAQSDQGRTPGSRRRHACEDQGSHRCVRGRGSEHDRHWLPGPHGCGRWMAGSRRARRHLDGLAGVAGIVRVPFTLHRTGGLLDGVSRLHLGRLSRRRSWGRWGRSPTPAIISIGFSRSLSHEARLGARLPVPSSGLRWMSGRWSPLVNRCGRWRTSTAFRTSASAGWRRQPVSIDRHLAAELTARGGRLGTGMISSSDQLRKSVGSSSPQSLGCHRWL